MILLKKLTFAPIFLIFLALFAYGIKPLYNSYNYLFSLSPDTVSGLFSFLAMPLVIAPLAILASVSFMIFAALALDSKIVIPIAILGSLMPVIFLPSIYGLVLMIGILFSLIVMYLFLESNLKSYITFNPNSLLSPQIKNLSILLILVVAFTTFLAISRSVPPTGFEISESFLSTSTKMPRVTKPQLPDENNQLDLLKQNPQLLKQFGLDPSVLDSLNPANQSSMTNQLINQAVKDQLQNIVNTLNPFINFIPPTLSALLFFNLLSPLFILNFLIHPILWLVFLILEKTNFVKFEIEQRPVKKMVI